MLNKKFLMLAILLVGLLTVSLVSAGENATDDVVSADNLTDDVMSDAVVVASFSELESEIDDIEEGGVLNLTRDYKFTNGYTRGVVISKSITIEGNNHTLDAKNLSRIFYITATNVVLKNINFINAKHDNGGAIYFDLASNSNIINSNFINCSSNLGGAIYYSGYSTSFISNSNFTDNTADISGGAVFVADNSNIDIRKAIFNGNSAVHESGGAVMMLNSNFDAEFIEINNCFSQFGGAITLLSSNASISKSYFRKNYAVYDGGAIYSMFDALNLTDNVFTDNHAKRAGAIYSSLNDLILLSNDFMNNSAENVGAVFAMASISKNINENVFMNNSGLNDLYETFNDNLTINAGDYYQFQYQNEDYNVLPDYYNLKEHAYLTPVKDQGVDGNCWAFSAIAALESCILKATSLVFDLSEANLKNLMAYYSDYGYDILTNLGGNYKMASGYFASWFGPINEIDDSYYTNDFLSPLLTSILHVQNILYLKRTDYGDNDAIKNAILRYGAVSTGMYYKSAYLNGTSYYYNGDEYSNHAVCIVGWDDNYSRYNFKNTPLSDGAWIVRNSWGPSWGDDGYFYVSYYDTKFAQVNKTDSYTFILNDTSKLDRIYQLETLPTSFNNNLSTVCYKNIFTVEGDEYLASVSTYFCEKSDYKIEVYVNDNFISSKSGKSDRGYYTINLDDLIYLNKNDNVTVVVNLTNFENGYGILPLSFRDDCSNLFLAEKRSYYWRNGWVDLYDSDAVACIKIFTTFSQGGKLNPYLNFICEGDYLDGSYLITFSLPSDAKGLIYLNTSNNHYIVNLSETNSITLYGLNLNNNSLSITYSGDDRYLDKTVSYVVDINYTHEGTCEELSDKINMNDGILDLHKDFIFDSSITDGIVISKPITIDGHGHTISGSGFSRIFNILADNVIIRNIIFADSDYDGNGGAISVYGANCTIFNCSFISNNASGYGGAIYWIGENGVLNRSYFENNYAKLGGAILWNQKTGSIINCDFISNHASSVAGAVYINYDTVICNNSFINNSAENGGAIYINHNGNTIVNCSFENNNASYGGALYLGGNDTCLSNSSFGKNTAKYGGAVLWSGDRGKMVDCDFNNNHASSTAGAVYWMSDDGFVENSKFINNSAIDGGAVLWLPDSGNLTGCLFISNEAFNLGGAVYWMGNNSQLTDSIFINNSASNGGAVLWMGDGGFIINSTFNDNLANKTGGAVYWYGENGNLVNSTFINTLGKNQVYWFSEVTGNIDHCRFLNTTINNVINNKAKFNKHTINLGNSTYSLEYGNNENITVNLIGLLNDVPIDLPMIFNMSDEIHNVYMKNGFILLSHELDHFNAGEIIVKVMFEGDDNYNPIIANFTIIIRPAHSFIDLECVNTTLNHKTTLIVHIIDSMGNNVTQGSVTFFDGGAQIGQVEVRNGIASLTYTPETSGKHSITAIYDSDNYLSSNDDCELFVDEATINILDVNATVGFTTQITAKLTALYSIVNEGIVRFYIGDELIGTASVVNGSAVITHVHLNATEYTLKAIFSQSEKFSDDEATIKYTVSKADCEIHINHVNGTLNHSLTLTVTLSSSNNLIVNEGTVIFYDGETQIGQSQVKNGIAALDYVPTADGEHEITAKYKCNNYADCEDLAKVYVDSVDLQIQVDTGVVGFNSTFIANVNGLYSLINHGSVRFYVNNSYVGKSNVLNGVAKFTYVPSTAGSNPVKAVYGDSEIFSDKESSVNYIVNPASTQITINNIAGNVGDDLTLTANITSPNGLTINEGNVTFMEDGNLIGQADVLNGAASLTYTPVKSGKHQISAKFNGINYISSQNDLNISINQANTHVRISEVANVYYENPSIISIYVLSNGKMVKEGRIRVYVDNQEIGNYSLESGSVTIEYLAGSPGAFDVYAVFEETMNYLPSDDSARFTVEKLPTLISANGITEVYNDAKNIIVNLRDLNGKALTGEAISVNINGVKTMVTDSNGQVRISTNGLVPNTYNVVISFNGNANYAKSAATAKVIIKKATPKLTAGKKTFKKSVKIKKYAVTLKTNRNNPMANVKLTVKVNGKTFSAKTNAKGKATFKMKKLNKKGKLNAVLTYKGDRYYNKVTKKVKITIK